MPSPKDSTFKEGQKVKARWSGSNAYFDAKILDVFTKSCKVEFDDGTVTNVKLTDIKSPKSDKEEKEPPKRTRSRSRSVGRPRKEERSRSRSPARRTKKESSAKKEPAAKKEKSPKNDDSSNSIKTKDEVDSIFRSTLTREKIGSAKEEFKISSVTSSNSVFKQTFSSLDQRETGELRPRSARLAALRSGNALSTDSKREYEKSNASSRKDEAKYSDDEESDEEIKIVPKGPSKLRQSLSFTITLLKTLILPTSFLFLVYACSKRQCTVLRVPQFYSRWSDVGNALKYTLPSVILFHLAVCLLSLVPAGWKVTGFPFGPKKSTREYNLNGIFCLLIAFVAFGLCSYFEVYMTWGYDKFKSLSLGMLLYSIFCSLLMHITFLIKGEGSKESKIPVIGNFFSGVYINPFLFGKVDIKTSFIRAGLIGSMLINLSIVLKFFLLRKFVNIPLSCTLGMHLFFALDYFIREEKMLSTATYTTDGVGYAFMITFGFLVPVGLTLQNYYLYILEAKALVTPTYCYATTIALFLLGYSIYLLSSNLKHNFRSNPFSPALSGIESIPTSQKKRLIVSKLWGFIRHPNYLGLIIMATAWTLPCGFTHFVPYGPLLMLTLALILRLFKVEADCQEKYGPAWKNYAEKVRSRLIPFIF